MIGADGLAVAVLAAYFLIVLGVGLWAGRREQNSAEEYFLAGRRLPWYAVGMSMVGSNISTEHFIGMVGAAYIFGLAPANWELMSLLSLSMLLFFFLPYYFRTKIFTIPTFLETRFSPSTRVIFAALSTLHLVFALLAGALYAGGLILHDYFQPGAPALGEAGFSPYFLGGILLVAVVTGIYSVKGGLSSVVWTDVVQVIILVAGGLAVLFFSMDKAGGWEAMWEANNIGGARRTHLLHPADHAFAPWTGVFTLWMSLGLWYACTNQFYIQRAFGARSEWDARMGVILTGGIKMGMPLLVVIPGMAAFAIYGGDLPRDKVFNTLVRDLLPAGFGALVLAAMAAAIMSTISSVLNSASTILTIDFYQRFFRKDATQADLVRIGRWTTFGLLAVGIAWAPFIAKFDKGLFIYIQDMGAFFGPPIGVIFVGGMLWRGAKAGAANAALVGGMLFGLGLRIVSEFADWPLLDSFLNRAFITFVFSGGVLVAGSLIGPAFRARSAVWDTSFLRLPEAERGAHGGLRSFHLWWALWALAVVSLMLVFA